MGQPAARQGDRVVGAGDVHTVTYPNGGSAPLPHPFQGALVGSLVDSVLIEGKSAATVGSVARHDPPGHVPLPPGTGFMAPPSNQGTVTTGSATVLIGGISAARQGDRVASCSEQSPPPTSIVTGAPTVMIG